MSIEAGVLIGLDGEPIYWHLPNDCSAGHIPDSRELWDEMWENRDNLLGFAHSHPGKGVPSPSQEDISTFAAVEAALGEKIVWWIVSEDAIVSFIWVGPNIWDYRGNKSNKFNRDPVFQSWLNRLREESKY